MSDQIEASSSTSTTNPSTVQDASNGTAGTDGPSKPRARLGPVETVTLQEFDPDSDSEDEEGEEDGEAHIEEIEAQSEDFLKDHPDDTEVRSCPFTSNVERSREELMRRIYISNIFDLRILLFPHLNYLDSPSSRDYV